MHQVKKIQCPNCGSTSVFKKDNTHYKCNYCQSDFVVDKEPEDKEVPHEYYNEIIIIEKIQKQSKSKLFYIIGISLLLLSSSLIILFFVKNKNKFNALSNFINRTWKDNGTVIFFSSCVNDHKPYVVSVVNYQSQKLDSTWYELNVIDPNSKKIIKTLNLISGNWKELNTNNNIKFFSQGKYFVFIVEDSVFNVYEIPELLLKYSRKNLLETFPELKNQIFNTDYDYDKKIFIITNATDKKYFLDLTNGKLFTEKEYTKKYYEIQEVNEKKSRIYFTYGDNPFLVRAIITRKALHNNHIVDISDTNEFKNPTTLNFYGIKSIQLASNKIFYRYRFCDYYKDGVLFVYKENITPDGKIFISYADNKGNIKWQINDTILQKYLNISDQISFFTHELSDNKLILHINSFPLIVYCINVDEGKREWFLYSTMSFAR
ncbi:MAG: hypothetical protein N3F09_00100 [Bacteroidia bacterium]|nr:hypothetical protein [Bacteroidia bacterium]